MKTERGFELHSTREKQPADPVKLASLVCCTGLVFLLGLMPASTAFAGNPFAIDGIVPGTGIQGLDAEEFIDPSGSIQELGATNGSTTKLGAVHTALPPMLNFTNPNGQTDIVRIWLATHKDTSNDDTWLYFAWEREATSGSSVITYEFQQAGLPGGCDYSLPNVDFQLPTSTNETALIGNCNPWSGRQENDFLIVWDFKGGATDIILRTFLPTISGLQFDTDILDSNESAAALNNDTSRGEGAINLNLTVFPPTPTACTSIGNIIPGTITGNSDSADYKDAVLADFTKNITISNCGTVVIRKETDPDKLPDTFTFNHDLVLLPANPSDTSFNLTDDGVKTYTSVIPPTTNYTVTEVNLAPNFDLTDIDCSDSVGGGAINTSLAGRSVSFDLDPGEKLDCTFTNKLKRGKIIVDKVTLPSGSTKSFSFTANYQSGFNLADGSTPNDSGALLPTSVNGTYSVSEAAETGWDLTSATCDDGSPVNAINLAPGETVTCTFTNTQRGKIIVDKVTVPSGSTKSFGFTTNYGSGFNLLDGTTPNDSGPLVPTSGSSTYSVSESTETGWDLTSATCDDGSPVNAINLAPGETVTCTFTNTARANIRVHKITTGGYDGTFGFTSTSLSDFDLTTVSGSSGFSEFNDLTPGTFDVGENAIPNWTLVSGTCSDSSLPSSIGLAAGESITCTFTNTPKRGAIKITKTRKYASGTGDLSMQAHPNVKFMISGGSLAAPVPVTTDASGEACYDAGGSGLVYSAIAGNYTVTEIVPVGYVADGDLTATPGKADESVTFAKTVSVDQENGGCGIGDPAPNGVSFSNIPLTNVTITAASIDPGATKSLIECYQGTQEGEVITIGDDLLANPFFDDPQTLDLDNQLPVWPNDLIICTIKIDP